MTWAADGSFDRVLLALVLHHLRNPRLALSEFHRVLADDGRLVVSTVHPVSDWLQFGGSYFVDERIDDIWRADWRVSFRRAPLEALVADFAATGFVVETLIEPRPTPSMYADYPDIAERLAREPAFIAFVLKKAAGARAFS